METAYASGSAIKIEDSDDEAFVVEVDETASIDDTATSENFDSTDKVEIESIATQNLCNADNING